MKTHQIKLFWEWFYCNEITLRTLQKQNVKIQKIFTYWLDRHLHHYCDGLDCIIVFPEKPTNLVKLVISANGNPAYFEHVNALVAQAPKPPHWEIVAFIQPTQSIEEMAAGLDKPYVFQDITLKASELKFTPHGIQSQKKIDMVVYLKDFTVHCKNQNLLQVVFMIMQDLLGEKSLYQNINFVELAQLPEHETNEMIYLFELQAYLDQLNPQRTISPPQG